jgi:hypothetical protein
VGQKLADRVGAQSIGEFTPGFQSRLPLHPTPRRRSVHPIISLLVGNSSGLEEITKPLTEIVQTVSAQINLEKKIKFHFFSLCKSSEEQTYLIR